jgi:hypothetical protein
VGYFGAFAPQPALAVAEPPHSSHSVRRETLSIRRMQSINSLPPAMYPAGEIKRKDSTSHTFDLRHYIDLLREDKKLQRDFLRTWATGALLNARRLAAHEAHNQGRA